MFNNVKHFYTTYPECEVTIHMKAKQVPLPFIRTPFLHIAMDVFGLLENSSTGYQ